MSSFKPPLNKMIQLCSQFASRTVITTLAVALGIAVPVSRGHGQDDEPKARKSGKKVEKPVDFHRAAADPLVGDWQGEGAVVAQIYKREGVYQANLLSAFDQASNLVATLHVSSDGPGLRFSGDGWAAELKDGQLVGGKAANSFKLKHVVRTPPTLGAKPPKGAVVL
ncbi:MAG TPA: hypothetical protein VLT36_13080, partial [Candidatus Dormibacteraeota bacterium]|nr:hypothetical protein [Candidatus Dormibacteraeota bacterium]